MPSPKLRSDPSGRYTRPMVGKATAPVSLSVCPSRPMGGMPGPKALAEIRELAWVCGKSSSAPASNSERPRPLIVAGFQNRAPAALNGAAVAAPPIERSTAPVPDRIGPIWACAGAAITAASQAAEVRMVHFDKRRWICINQGSCGLYRSFWLLGFHRLHMLSKVNQSPLETICDGSVFG